jgi:hypothetical protein
MMNLKKKLPGEIGTFHLFSMILLNHKAKTLHLLNMQLQFLINQMINSDKPVKKLFYSLISPTIKALMQC